MIDTAIIGAGPYGLSIAAHLTARGVNFRIFGSPMHTWRERMPQGMRLKSDGFASNLYDSHSTFTLSEYCKQTGSPYADLGLPVPLQTFNSYGLEFQRRFVPELEDKVVTQLQQASNGFRLYLEDGEVVAARRTVLAVGLTHFAYVPPVFNTLSEEFVTHSSRHRSVEHFRGRDVAVIGAGASAVDLAALLHQAGVSVHLVARRSTINFHTRGKVPRPLRERIRRPTTGLGPGWFSFFCVHAPRVFRLLSDERRLKWVRSHLGPAPGWFVRDEVVGKVPFRLGVSVVRADVQNGRVSLELTDAAGTQTTLRVDHVIAATGYRVDLSRLTFLNSNIRDAIENIDQMPRLSSTFESSVPGLYFVGAAAAGTFGPLLRFAFGARFTARRLSKHLARSGAHDAVGVTDEGWHDKSNQTGGVRAN